MSMGNDGSGWRETGFAGDETGEVSRTLLHKHARMILDHLWGPTGSVLLHILLVVLLFRYLVWEIPLERQDGSVIYQMTPDRPPVRVPQHTQPDMQETSMVDDPIAPPPRMVAEVHVAEAYPEIERQDHGQAIGLADLNRVVIEGPNQRPPRGVNHPEATAIGQRMNMALEWLMANQRPDGSWVSPAYDDRGVTAVTALALMAYLSYGETPASPHYGETVRKAIEYLLREQERSGPAGAFCVLDQQGVYAHGIATYAISEAFAATLIPGLAESMDAAVLHIVRGQQPGGGFDYHFNQGPRRDTSVAGWMIQAMRAAHMAGSRVEGLSEAIGKSAEDIKRAALGDGRFGYTAADPHPATTAIGTLALQLTGHRRDPVVVAALNHLRAGEACSWSGRQAERAMYTWFYTTQVKFHHGGVAWATWERQMIAEYLRAQEEDGHWRSPGNEHERHGYAYTTALGALTLQIPLQKVLLFQRDAIRPIPRAVTGEEANETERIEVEFI